MQARYSFITFAAIIAVGILYQKNVIELKDIGTSALALLGTFLGATLAFRLTETREKENIEKSRREALNRAIFILIRQHNAVAQIKRDMDKFPSLFEKAFNMPAFKPPDYGDLTHKITDMEFLIDSEDPNILFNLTIEQERFHQAIESITIRNNFYVDEVQPEMDAKSIHGEKATISEIQILLGNRIYSGAISSANIAYEHISASSESIPQLLETLRSLAKRIYPKHKFLDYENPNEPATNNLP